MVSPVLMLPSKFTAPIAPAYQRRDERSWSSELHRPQFRRPGHRHRPGMSEERIERVEARPQHAFDMIYGVEQF